MIDIIIPVYNARDTLFSTLSSIAFQSIKDKVTVHIVDDFSSCTYHDILEKFNFDLNIKYYRLEKNSGPGVARNFALKRLHGDFVCFVDSDDLFFSYQSLEYLYKVISKGFDMVSGKVYYEKFSRREFTSSDLHGKIYRREFIEKNNIVFPNIRVHEDNIFHNLIRLYNPKCFFIEDIVYVYSDNPNSVTSVDGDIEFKRLEILIKNSHYVIERAINDKFLEKLIRQFIFEKTKYFSKRYKILSAKEKRKLYELIDKSLLDSKYLGETNYVKMKFIIFRENLDKYQR